VNCLDCATEHHTERPAVAVCVHCGAGVCLPHARITAGPPVELPTILAATTAAPASRQVHCLTCTASRAGADAGTLLSEPFVHSRGRRTGRPPR